MLEIIDLHKQYEGKPLLKGVSFNVEQGETVCLLGSSGSGKSTILQIISGLQEPEKGQVLWIWQGYKGGSGTQAKFWFNVPGLCPFSPPQCPGKHCFRAAYAGSSS